MEIRIRVEGKWIIIAIFWVGQGRVDIDKGTQLSVVT